VRLLPSLSLGLANHWIFLVFYAVALLVATSRLSKERRLWLFADPKGGVRGIKIFLLRAGQVLAFAFLAVVCFTPLLQAPVALSVVGLGLYGAGTVVVVVSIHYFGKASIGRPTLEGPYRLSRNPQWVGLFGVFLGLAISCGSWLLLVAVAMVGAIYHIQILEEERMCRAEFGPEFDDYLRRVPRYVRFAGGPDRPAAAGRSSGAP